MTKDAFIAMVARLSLSGDPDAPAASPGSDAIETLDSLINYARQIRDTPAVYHDGGPDFSDPDDRAVTAAAECIPGNLDAGLVPCIELGGVQVGAWRQGGALQVDVLLEDARPDDWKLDGNQLTVTVTVAGLTADSDQHELESACYRCGSDNTGGDGYMGLCPNCADADYAAGNEGEAD